MLKRSQIFDFEHEPALERRSEFEPSRHSRFSEASSYGALDALQDPATRRAMKEATLAPEARRSPPGPLDRMLSKLAIPWVEMLPPEAIPRYLCEHFPRIVNRLALCWADRELALKLLDDLLKDKRGGRRGFPPEALTELKSLREVASRGAKIGLKLAS